MTDVSLGQYTCLLSGPSYRLHKALQSVRLYVSVRPSVPLFQICITLPVESALFFIPSTSFCSLSSWFTSSCTHHLMTVTSHHLRSHHLSLPRPFTSDLKLICSTNPFLSSLSGSIRTASTDLGRGQDLLGTMGSSNNLKLGATWGQGPGHRGQWKSACGACGPNVDQG